MAGAGVGTTGGRRTTTVYTPREHEALSKMLEAANRVAKEFEPLSPWGAASQGIARELSLDLGVELP
jgi:hypothetical protein